jgi:two-component system NarL family response regulator
MKTITRGMRAPSLSCHDEASSDDRGSDASHTVVRVLLADDHQLLREALRTLLEQDRTLEVVAETGDGLEAVKLAQQTHPDVVCMDVSMPGMNGIETTRQLLAVCPEIKVLALSALNDRSYVLDMIDAGASGYVTKAAASDELLRAIRAVRNGKNYFCSNATASIMTALRVKGGKQERTGAARLGAREREVLQLVAEGHSSSDIAILLHISPSTIDVHRRNIMRKLDLHSVAELTKVAVRYGLTPA